MNKKSIDCESPNYWVRWRAYHKDDMWGRFDKWLRKLNKKENKQ